MPCTERLHKARSAQRIGRTYKPEAFHLSKLYLQDIVIFNLDKLE
jgi:hypothetical protein